MHDFIWRDSLLSLPLNLIGACFVGFCLKILLVFLFKLSRENYLEVNRLKRHSFNGRTFMRMASLSKVESPFMLKVVAAETSTEHQNQNSKVMEPVLEITTKVKLTVQMFYCVAIDEIRKLYNSNHPHYKGRTNKTLENSLEILSSFQFKERNVIVPDESNTVRILLDLHNIPENIQMNINEIIQDDQSSKFIPLVILMSVVDHDSSMENNDIVALASVITAKNQKFEIAEQYIQTVDERVILLKQIYDSGITTSNVIPSAPELPADVDTQTCVVCHEYPVTRVILPCRHACLCKLCFVKVNTCPVCRILIQSFFLIRTESDLPSTAEEVQNEIRNEIHNMGIWNFIKSVWNAG